MADDSAPLGPPALEDAEIDWALAARRSWIAARLLQHADVWTERAAGEPAGGQDRRFCACGTQLPPSATTMSSEHRHHIAAALAEQVTAVESAPPPG